MCSEGACWKTMGDLKQSRAKIKRAGIIINKNARAEKKFYTAL